MEQGKLSAWVRKTRDEFEGAGVVGAWVVGVAGLITGFNLLDEPTYNGVRVLCALGGGMIGGFVGYVLAILLAVLFVYFAVPFVALCVLASLLGLIGMGVWKVLLWLGSAS